MRRRMTGALLVVLPLVLATGGAAAQRQYPIDTSRDGGAPMAGVHVGEPQALAVTLGWRYLRRENAAIASIEPGVGGIRAGVGYGRILLEEGNDKDSRFAFLVVGAQVQPSIMQTLWHVHGADPLATYAGIDVRMNLIFGAGVGYYWKLAGRDRFDENRRIVTLEGGFSY